MEAQESDQEIRQTGKGKTMTPINLIRTNFTEIAAMEITCKNCKSVSSIVIPRENISKQFQCIGCNTALWNSGGRAAIALMGLMRTLSTWKEVSEGAPFELGFSIETPASPEKPASRASDSKA